MWKLPDSPLFRGIAVGLGTLAVVAMVAVLPPLGQGVAVLVLVCGGYLVWQARRS